MLVALADGEQGAEVLLTRRSRHMRNHKGEISFPGGRIDPGETPAEAALREADEEVGLDPSLVTLFGELTTSTPSSAAATSCPLVGRLASTLAAAPASVEVERVLWLPLAELVRPDTYRSERWGRTPTDRLLHFFELDDETVWGATRLHARRPPQPPLTRGLPSLAGLPASHHRGKPPEHETSGGQDSPGAAAGVQAASTWAHVGGAGADRDAQGDARRRARCG